MTVIFHMSKNPVIFTLGETPFFSQDLSEDLFGAINKGEGALKILHPTGKQFSLRTTSS